MKQLKVFLYYIRYGFYKIPSYLRGIVIFAIFALMASAINSYYKERYLAGVLIIPEDEYSLYNGPLTINSSSDIKEDVVVDKANSKVEGSVKENLKSSPFFKKKRVRSNESDDSALKITELDYVFGDGGAPVTIVEYSSFKCPYCIKFHRDTMQKIKENYIDTGKVKYVKRIIIQKDTLGGVMLPRCAKKENQYQLLNDLYENTGNWTVGSKKEKSLREIALRNGFGNDTYEFCIKDSVIANRLLDRQNNDLKKLNVYSTPTIFINGTKKTGSMPYSEFASKIDEELKKVEK